DRRYVGDGKKQNNHPRRHKRVERRSDVADDLVEHRNGVQTPTARVSIEVWILLLKRCRNLSELGLRRCDRHAGLWSCDDFKVVASAVVGVCSVDRKRDPEIFL